MKSIKYIDKLANLRAYPFWSFEDIKDKLVKGKAGTSKYTDEKLKTRFYSIEAIEDTIQNIDIIFSEKAKYVLYLTFDLLGLKKFRNIKNEAIRPSALYTISGLYRNYSYVDIKDNHFTIIKRYFNCNYKMNSYLSLGSKDAFDLLDEMQLSKRVKRTIYGIMRSNSIMFYQKVENEIVYSMKKAYHSFYNPDLSNLIADISHSIAIEVINNYGAVYYNTDGMIVPSENAEKVIAFLNELGFEAKIKHSGYDVEIKAIGCYRFDSYKTGNYDRIKLYANFSNLNYNIDRQFLFKRLSNYWRATILFIEQV